MLRIGIFFSLPPLTKNFHYPGPSLRNDVTLYRIRSTSLRTYCCTIEFRRSGAREFQVKRHRETQAETPTHDDEKSTTHTCSIDTSRRRSTLRSLRSHNSIFPCRRTQVNPSNTNQSNHHEALHCHHSPFRHLDAGLFPVQAGLPSDFVPLRHGSGHRNQGAFWCDDQESFSIDDGMTCGLERFCCSSLVEKFFDESPSSAFSPLSPHFFVSFYIFSSWCPLVSLNLL